MSVLAAAVLLCFAPLLVPGQVLFTPDEVLSDLGHFFIPLRVEVGRALAEGRLPVWTRDLGTGLPILAEGQAGVFYPPALLAHLLPVALGINLLALSSLLIAGAGTFRWARTLGLPAAPAAFAGLVAALCGWNVVHLKHLSLVAVAAWTPWLLAGGELALRGETGRAAARVALAVGMMALAGNPTAMYFSLLVAGVHAALGAALARRPRALAVLLAGVGLGLALGAMQLAPSLDYLGQSSRGAALTWEQANSLSFHPRHLWMFLFPFAFGDPARGTWPITEAAMDRLWPGVTAYFWEVCAYVGWAPLALALAAVVLAWRGRRDGAFAEGVRPRADDVLRLALLALFCLLLVLGERTPLGPLLFRALPGFDRFRFHSRFLLHVDLALAMLAACGAHALLSRVRAPRRSLAWALLGAVALADLHAFARDQNVTVDARAWLRRSPVADMLAGAGRVHALFPSTPWSEAQAGRAWREAMPACLATRAMPAPDTGLLDGIATLDMYAALTPARHALVKDVEADLLRAAAVSRRGGPRGVRQLDLSRAARPLEVLGLLGVAWLASPVALLSPLLEPAGGVEGVHLYRLRTARPRAFVAHAAEQVRDEHGALSFWRSAKCDMRVLPVEAQACSGEVREPTAARTLESGADGLTVEVVAERPGWLFVSEMADPGWSATLDDQPARMVPAAGLGMAVGVPAGPHRLALRYRCRTLPIGIGVSAAAVLLTVLLLHRSRAGLRGGTAEQ